MYRIAHAPLFLVCALSFAGASLPAQRSTAGSAAASTAAPAPAAAAAQGGKRILGLADIGRWNHITDAALTADGRWMSYVVVPNEGDATLHFRQTNGPATYAIPVGSSPVFSKDSHYGGYLVSPPSASQGSGGAGAVVSFAGPARQFELLDLATGTKYDVSNANTFEFSNDSRFVAVRTTTKSDPSASQDGTDLVLRDLRAGTARTIQNVNLYAFNEAGTLFAYTVDVAGRVGNGVYLLDLGTGQFTALSSGQLDYAQLAWSDSGNGLAALRGDQRQGFVQRDNSLLVWPDVSASPARVVEFDPSNAASFPAGHVLSELAPLRWAHDASRIYLGLKAQSRDDTASGGSVADVDIWGWNDAEVESVRLVRQVEERRATLPAVFDIAAGTLVPLADSVMRDVAETHDPHWAIGRIDTAYQRDVEWEGGKSDFYRVSTDDGRRTLIARGLLRTMGSSPDGKWFLYLKDKNVYAYDVDAGRSTQLAARDTISFVDVTDDHPYEKPIYGVAGWSRDGRSVILDHRYDLYEVPLDGGKIANLTRRLGDAQQIRFRLVRLGDDRDSTVDLSKPLLLSAYGEWTKRSGYYVLSPGAKPVPLIYDDEQIGQAIKAQSADVVLFTRQTFKEPPDYWATTTTFSAPRKMTNANPFVSEYAWGSRILVDFKNSKGQRLQGTLTLPANYQPGKRYPMLVYIYEKLSNTLHTFPLPIFDDRPHFAEYASDGYLIFEPDIDYVTGKPGSSALDCVTSGVNKVIQLGYADPQHIGLQGHSWGGYESAYILTRSHMFAAVVTGAPPTDLTSFYDEIYPETGELQQGIVELGQVRMGTNPWDSPALFADQSPITHVRDITTPFLILQGTADDVVDFHQGLELYAAARRWGKQVILLSYPGERHHLALEVNQMDFQRRMKQFFDHYLKGTPAPNWMTDGIPPAR